MPETKVADSIARSLAAVVGYKSFTFWKQVAKSIAEKLGLYDRPRNLNLIVLCDDDEENVADGQPRTNKVDDVLAWGRRTGQTCPWVETAMIFPSPVAETKDDYPCPIDFMRMPFTWDNQEYHIGRMLSVIHSAKHSVDMCMYMVCSHPLSRHLKYVFQDRKREGKKVPKKVRVILYEPYYADMFGRSKNVELKKWRRGEVGAGGDGIHQDGEMHLKFFIVDKKVVFFGSSNFTVSAFSFNFENNVVTSHKRKVKCFQEQFNHLWEHPQAEPFTVEGQTKYRPPKSMNRMWSDAGGPGRGRSSRGNLEGVGAD